MLHTFRKASDTWVVKLLFAILALSFVAWGVGDFVRRGAFGTGPALAVGGEEITANDVQMEFKRQIQRMQSQFKGQLTEEMARKMGLMDQTIQDITTRLLVDHATRDLGLKVSDATVLQAITNNPSLKNEQGVVDRERLRASLARMGMTEAEYMKIARAEQTRQQLGQAITGGVVAPNALVEPLLRRRFEQRVADAVEIADSAVPAPAAPAAEELEKFYKDNTARFMAPEYRALTIMLLRPADVASQITISDEDLANAYDQRQGEFNVPEKRQSSQILLTEQDKADQAAELVAQGKDMAAIAKALNVHIIDLGTVAKAELPDELKETVFQTAPGATSAPVRSDLGWHVIKVLQVHPAQVKSLEQVKPMLTQAVKHDRTVDLLAELSNKIEDALGGGANMEEAARRFGLTVVTVDAVDAKGLGVNGKHVDQLPKDANFLNVAFHTDQGTESQVTENGPDGYFLVRVDGVTAPAPHPLARIKNEVLAAWSAGKRHELALEKAKSLQNTFKESGLTGIARGTGITIKTSPAFTRDGVQASGLPAAAVAKVFDSKVGDVALSEVGDGWVLTRLSSIVPVDLQAHPELINRVRSAATQALDNDVAETFLAALEAKIGVKIDRSQLTREE